MIQHWLKDRLIELLPNVTVTADYQADQETYVTVFYEGGDVSDRSGRRTDGQDFKFRNFRYMVWIESVDWGLSEHLARQIYLAFADYPGRPVITVEYFDESNTLLYSERMKLHSLGAASDVNPIGVFEGKRQFSVNFDATLTLIKEESSND